MSAVTFDTLRYVERLEKAGASRELASALVEIQKETLADAMDTTLATKTDTALLRSDLRELKAELLGEMRLNRWMLGVVIAMAVANFALQRVHSVRPLFRPDFFTRVSRDFSCVECSAGVKVGLDQMINAPVNGNPFDGVHCRIA